LESKDAKTEAKEDVTRIILGHPQYDAGGDTQRNEASAISE
jgi:hypothetical protein